MEISKLGNNLLDPNNKLFEILKQNPPIWWRKLKEDNDLYIEVRKNNIIEAYYNGGRLAEIKYNSRNKDLSVKTHPKYLGHDNVSETRFYRISTRNGKTSHDAIYQECKEEIEKDPGILKKNIIKFYSGVSDGENTLEKLIQGTLILHNRNKYIDSEFAHRFYNEERKTIRIDLVGIENNKLYFEELKRVIDSRQSDTEILTQMKEYSQFIDANAKPLEDYYKTLYIIKQSLSLPVPKISDIQDLKIDKIPRLIICQNYNKISKSRLNRIKNIEEILKVNHLKYQILKDRQGVN